MNLQEMLDARETKRSRMGELMELKKGENRRFTPEEREEFEGLETDLDELDEDILTAQFEQRMARGAVTRVRGGDPDEQRAARGGASSSGPIILKKKYGPDDKFPGQTKVRVIIAKALSMLTGDHPLYIAQQRGWDKSHPMLAEYIRATVAGHGTGSGEAGAELVQYDGKFSGDFVEFLYGMTVFDRLPLRQVPARVKVKGQDGAHTGYWVGESKAIPASKGDYSAVDLDPLKVAALCVMSREWLEDSTPSGEMLVRDSLGEAHMQRIDTTFLSAAAASAGVSPAGLLNGLSALTSAGTSLANARDDLTSLLYPFVTNKMARGIQLVMNPAQALALSMMYGSLDQPAFPEINENGGTINGRPVVTGDNVTAGDVIALRPQDIWRIGDSGVEISMSREATIEQRDDPSGATDTPTGVNTTGLTNMFQEDSVAIRLIRRINYAKRRSTAVVYMSNVEWGGVTS